MSRTPHCVPRSRTSAIERHAKFREIVFSGDRTMYNSETIPPTDDFRDGSRKTGLLETTIELAENPVFRELRLAPRLGPAPDGPDSNASSFENGLDSVVGLVCGFIEIERNIQLDPNRLTILHPWLKYVLLDCLDCLLIQPHTKTANDTNVGRISIGLNN